MFGFSYKNEERKGRMTRRFEVLGHPIIWVDPVLVTDPRITVEDTAKRPYAIMFNHIDMIEKFLKESTAEYGVFCEDEIYVRRDFDRTIQVAIDGYKRLGLDVLLLGYLTNYKAFTCSVHCCHHAVEPPFAFLSVEEGLWGSQMYMMDHAAAQRVYDGTCTPDRVSTHFSPDWTITKFGRTAAIYPMLAVEEGHVVSDHQGQINFHRECVRENYDPELHF